MKTCVMLLCLLIISSISLLISLPVNGYLEEIEDKTILRVKGTIAERGYTQGYLVGENIHELFTGYFIPVLFNNNPTYYNTARSFFVENFEVDQKYLTESQEMINGMIDRGIDLHLSVLNRDLDRTDLLMSSSIVDLLAAFSYLTDYIGACSSISSWGSSTIDLPEVSGEQIITRHLDWTYNSTLLENHLITVHFPAEEEYQNWINIGIAGFMGSLSAVNQNRVGAFYNVGNNNSYSPESLFHPVLLSLRNAIESEDYNNDGVNNFLDIQNALQDNNFLSASIIHTAELLNEDACPVVFEVNNEEGLSVRTCEDNHLNPSVPADNLVATNHFRTLYDPIYCNRYQRIADSLQVSTEMTPERSWTLLYGAAALPSNIQAMQYLPITGELKWAASQTGDPAHSQLPTVFDIDYLLTYDEDAADLEEDIVVSEHKIFIRNYPNPFNPVTNIFFLLEQPSEVELKILNTRGQTIHTVHPKNYPAGEHCYIWDTSRERELTSGIYFLRVKTDHYEQYHKMMLIK